MNINVLGIDLAKNIFQLHGIDITGRSILRKKLARQQLFQKIVSTGLKLSSSTLNLGVSCVAMAFG